MGDRRGTYEDGIYRALRYPARFRRSRRDPLIAIEPKHAAGASPEGLAALAADALAQIGDRAYDAKSSTKPTR